MSKQRSPHARIARLRVRQEAILGILLSAAFSPAAWALPQGPVVVNGQVAISQPAGNTMQVQASNGSIINWNQFSIGAGEVTRFIQPSASSAVLNRVVGQEASQILGQLQSNGRVFLINPNGIVIGAGARIDTAGLIASTLDITDADFLAGKLRFFSNGANGSIRNDGVITAAPGGRIALIAPNIENNGIVQAPDGKILLAAGHKVEISSMDFEGVSFEVQAPTDSALNLGKLLADNGAVQVFAGTLRQAGEIRANRMVQDADGSIRLVGTSEVTLTADSVTRADGLTGGKITIQSPAGTTRIAGEVTAQGQTGTGGDIRLLGNLVAVESGARVDASGALGGGQILVGGDYQGKNPDVQNASRVFVGSGALLRADATQNGNGGRIIVWSNENTRYYGDLSVRGGYQGGNGGFAEVSGKLNLEFAGSADLTAPLGSLGFLLLDPLDIIISNSGGSLSSLVDQFGDFQTNVVTISPTALNTIGGNVILEADRNIYFNSAFTFTGSSLTATAAKATSSGTIYLNQNLATTGGAINLNASTVSGSGSISTAGGAVNINATGNLNYSGLISSGGGNVSLASGGSINYAKVNAGAGSITATGATGVSSGTFNGGGTVSLNATRGNVEYNNVTAGTANLVAGGSTSSAVRGNNISATGTVSLMAPGAVIDNAVSASRVNATSTGSYVSLNNRSGQVLRLGTINGSTGVYLYSNGGMTQESGGLITGPTVSINGQNALAPIGSASAPLNISTSSLSLKSLGAPAYIALAGNPILNYLELQGTLAGLAGTSLTGAANLSAFSLSAGTGVLNASVSATGGFGSGFRLSVSDAGIALPTLSMAGAPVTLNAAGAISLGAATVGSLSATAQGSISATSITSTGDIGLSAQKCLSSYTCLDTSNITAGTLVSSAGNISLRTYDNGNISVATLNAGGNATLTAGRVYYSYSDYKNHATANNISLGTITTGGYFQATDYGVGNISASGNINAGGSVSLTAGSSYWDSSLGSTLTASAISVAGIQAGGSISLTNSGAGAITATGNLSSSSGNLSLSTQKGAISATGANTAAYSASFTATDGDLTLGTVSTTSGNVTGTINGTGNLAFQSISAGGTNHSVTLTAATGHVGTTADNTAADVTATGDVTISAGGSIGNSGFANPLDIKAGSASTVSLTAGGNIGAAGKTVNVDTNGTIKVSAGGQFHVAARNAAGVIQTVRGIELAASASGMGSGGTSSFTSQDLAINASSDGSIITIGDIVQSANTLDKFSFTAAGSGLTFGNVNLSTAGYNQFILSAGGPLTQTAPVTTNNISAGYINLNAGTSAVTVGNVTASSAVGNAIVITGGDITAGNLNAPSLSVSGANLSLGSVTTTGTHRGDWIGAPYYTYLYDKLVLTATGNLATSGNITSATSASVTAGGNLTVGSSGNGTVSAGNGYYDQAKVWAGMSGTSTLAAGAISGYSVDVKGKTVITGNLTALTSDLTLLGENLTTGNLSGYNVNVTGTNFNTGNIAAVSSLNLKANAGYTAGNISLSGSSLKISALDGDIDLSGASSVTAPTANFDATGLIKAALTNTTALTLNTGGTLDIASTGTLNALSITAKGNLLGSASSITGNGGQVFSLAYDTATPKLDLAFHSTTGINASYTEASAVTGINASANLGSGSALTLNAKDAALTATSVALGSGSVNLSSTGNVSLTSVTTSGQVTATSTTGNINVEKVTTLGYDVTLTANAGSILKAGNQTHQIDTANGSGAASGTVTLNATQGSIGGAGSPIHVAHASGLSLTAKDSIQVDTANTLTNLSITTNASGTGAIAITKAGAPAFSLSRSGDDLVLGPIDSTTAANFALAARDGNIRVNGDINLTSLTLDAKTGNSAGNVYVQASGGPRTITTTGSTNLYAGQDILIEAGTASGQNIAVQAGGGMDLNAGRDILVKANGGSALLNSTSNWNYQYLTAGRDIKVQGGSNGVASTSATVAAAAYQTISATGDLIIQAGSANGASASVQTTGSQYITANNLSVLAGSGGAAFAKLQADYQSMSYIHGNVTVQGGAGTGAYAEIVATGSNQYLGNQSTYYNNPTDNITVQGGTGSGAYASIRAAGSQTVYGGGTVSVIGGSGGGGGTSGVCGTGNGAFAEICAGGTQNVGSNGIYSNDPTANIIVQAGSGGNARILAGSTQSVVAGGSISVLGGSGANMTASIETSGGSQTIGSTYLYSYDPTDSIVVQGGTGTGAAAWIKSAGSQTVDAGQNITLTGGAAGSYAEISSGSGTQTIGNLNSYYDNTDAISLTGGAANAYAKITAGGTQTIKSAAGMTLTGGTATGADAGFVATGSQAIQTLGNLTLTGGTGTNTFITTSSTSQAITAGGNLTLNGGSSGSNTSISQGNLGGGTQTITVGGSLALRSTQAGAAVTSIDAYGGANNQTIQAGGAISLDNQTGLGMAINSSGAQSIQGSSLDVRLSSAQAASYVELTAGGNQAITLTGTGTPGTAFLTLGNTSGSAGSYAQITTTGNQNISMAYGSAGTLRIGDAAGQGTSRIRAQGNQTIVAGDIIVQGGATAAASSKLYAAGTMDISAITGSVQVLGGAAGSASIDPTYLSLAANGSVIVQGGGASTATADITAGNLQIAATNGNILITGGSVPGATATIAANGTPGTANLYGSGNMVFTPNAGGAIVSALAPSGNNIFLNGYCYGCSTGLAGAFNVVTGLLPTVTPMITTPLPSTQYDLGANSPASDILALFDSLQNLYGMMTLTENGEIVLESSRRKLPQCN